MIVPSVDDRTPERKALDEAIAAEPPLPIPDLPPDTVPMPHEAHLLKKRSSDSPADGCELGETNRR